MAGSSPVFYDGEVTWSIGRRDTRQGIDFDYTSYMETLPALGSVGRIMPQLCGVPSNRTTNTYNNLPCFISVKSKELRARGGYVKVGFILAYSTVSNAYNSVSFTASAMKAKLDVSGSLAHANSSGYNLTISQITQVSNPNTTMFVQYPETYDIFDLNVRGATHYDGSNFPKKVYMLEGGQITDDFGLGYTTIYEFGDTSVAWNKLNYVECRIYVEANTSSLNDTVFLDLTNAITGVFKSKTETVDVLYGDTLYESVSAYVTNPIYLCPVYCYALSQETYETVEYYLSNINADVSALSSLANAPSAEQTAWLNQYSAQVAQIKAEAASAAAAAQYTFEKPNTGNLDVMQFVDPTAKQGIMYVVGKILSHTKIIAIVTICMMCGLIGYIFYGKKE
jgi:hypothetical protein